MKEIFKDIPNYEGIYQVSNLGNVKSLKFGKEKIIKKSFARGYHRVGLFDGVLRKQRSVHQLVAEAFLNHTPCGHELVVNHKNNIKTDNRVENLELITQRENTNKKHLKSKSKYTGVSFCKNSNKWVSYITYKGKQITIGRFNNEIDAYNSYLNKLNQLTVK
jgi:hypothetical protein